MRKKKPFLIVFVAIVLTCSIPIQACGLSIDDSDMQTYRPVDKVSGRELGEFKAVGVWYHFYGSDYESVGIYDSGMPTYAFIIWVPLQGYYLISIQSMSMRYQLKGTVNAPGYIPFDLYGTLYITKDTNGGYDNSYYNWRGDGTYAFEYDSARHWQAAFLDNYVIFHKIYTKSVNGTPQRSSNEEYIVPRYEEPPENLKDFIQSNLPSGSATAEYLDGRSSEIPTSPDGSPVPTNEAGNPIPTYPDGTPAPTYPNGNPAPTEPDGTPSPTYPNGNPVPSTVYDGDFGNELNTEFSKLYSLVNDLDQASSIMESNAEIMSSHCDSTRTLLNDVIGWLPSSVVACLVCGCIMIIAVKITGSGKS